MVSYDNKEMLVLREVRGLHKARKQDIEKFLEKICGLIDQEKYCLVKREKNLATLAQLGLQSVDVIDLIKNLEWKDYISGPDKDRDRPRSAPFWKFKITIDEARIYVKIKADSIQGEAKIVSFHFDEY